MSMTILLVEDDGDQALLFAQVLTLSGYRVTTVDSAAAAQARLIEAPVDLLVTDWDLPGGQGGDALIVWVRTRYPGIKTVLFSNHDRVHEVARACGANAGYRKIEGIGRFRELICSLVAQSGRQA